jgi:hypothetical protein
MQGNLFATLVFFLWVPLTLWAMRRHRSRPALAVASLLLGAVMFLPEVVEFKLPGIPPFSKYEIAISWVWVGILLWHRPRLREVTLGPAAKILFLLIPIGAVGTALTNQDPLVYGPRLLPPLRPYDAVHFFLEDVMRLAMPFLAGAVIFRTRRDLRELMMVLAFAGIVYAPLMLIEARLSPQLHNWVYGFAQHVFLQTMRWGGYRPMVFMNHGLALALFIATGLIASAALLRARRPIFDHRPGRVTLALGFLLFVCKTVSSMLYGYVGAALAFFGTPKAQVRLGMVLASALLVWPLMRLHGLVHTDELVDTAKEWVDAERAQSLEFRLVNEEVLFDRALERARFGWGGFSRASIFDPFSGKELSTRDGAWIITLGERGYVGFLATFGLLALPVFFARRRLGSVAEGVDRRLLAALALLVGIHAFDLIPNGRYSYMGHLLAGSLYGLATGLPLEARRRRRREHLRSSALTRELAVMEGRARATPTGGMEGRARAAPSGEMEGRAGAAPT